MKQDRLRSKLHDASCEGWTLLRATIVLHYTLACVLLTPCCAGQNQVTGPSQTIVVTAGDDVILPCYLGPTVDASGKTVEWSKQDLEPKFVLVWRDGAELQNQKNPDYKGRTSLFIDKLTYGDVSLKVSRVRISDRGKYRCFTPSLGKESTVELVVGAVSSITINLKKNNTVSGAVELDCESKGWYPEPEVLWLDSKGNLLSAGPTETLRAPDDLYTVSSRLTVEKRHGNSFTCRVQQNHINQTRLTHIQLSDDLFLVHPSPVGRIFIVSVVGVMCVLAPAVATFITRRKKISRSQQEKKEINIVRVQTEHQSLMRPEAETEQLLVQRAERGKDKLGEELEKYRSELEHVQQVIRTLNKHKVELKNQRDKLTSMLQEIIEKIKSPGSKKAKLQRRKEERDELFKNSDKLMQDTDALILKMTEMKVRIETDVKQVNKELKQTEVQRKLPSRKPDSEDVKQVEETNQHENTESREQRGNVEHEQFSDKLRGKKEDDLKMTEMKEAEPVNKERKHTAEETRSTR